MITIGVHGFQYDVNSKVDEDNPEKSLWPTWSKQISPFIGFNWYSYPKGFDSIGKAWAKGQFNRYYAAWRDAEKLAAPRLVSDIMKCADAGQDHINLIGHSLGTRVILCAMEQTRGQLPVDRILLLSGADTVDHASKVAPLLNCEVMNVAVKDDGVLKHLGRWFTPELGMEDTIGRHAVAPAGVDAWVDWFPEDADDHWDAWKTEEYWKEYRKFLS